MHLACQAIGLGPGDEVLVPSLTYVASFQAISATGATPVACEVLESCALLDLDDARKRVTNKTKAIMPVHYASYCADLDAVYGFAKEHNLRVIDDAAQAFGCQYKGKKIGSFGDVTCFSFDGIKNITCGEGGAVVTTDQDVVSRAQDARLLGVQKDTEKRFKDARSWEYQVSEQGWRYHMSNMMAAIGLVQLKRFESEFKPARQTRAKQYRELLESVEGVVCLETDMDGTVPHIIPVRIVDGKRDVVRDALQKADIQTGIHYKPNHLLVKYGGGQLSLPVAERLYTELLTLPLHPDISSEDAERVVEIIKNTL